MCVSVLIWCFRLHHLLWVSQTRTCNTQWILQGILGGQRGRSQTMTCQTDPEHRYAPSRLTYSPCGESRRRNFWVTIARIRCASRVCWLVHADPVSVLIGSRGSSECADWPAVVTLILRHHLPAAGIKMSWILFLSLPMGKCQTLYVWKCLFKVSSVSDGVILKCSCWAYSSPHIWD